MEEPQEGQRVLVDCLPNVHEALGLGLGTHKPRVLVHTCDSSVQEVQAGLEVQGQPWLHRVGGLEILFETLSQ